MVIKNLNKVNKKEQKREKIKKLLKKQISTKEIAKIVKIPYSTLTKQVSRYKKIRTFDGKKSTGRPKLISPIHKKIIFELINKNPKISTNKIAIELKERTQLDISRETIRRFLHSNNYESRTSAVKP